LTPHIPDVGDNFFLDTMDKGFKVKFNPLIPLFRLIWVIAAGAFLTRIIYFSFTHYHTDTTRSIWIFLIGVPLVGFLFYIPLRGLLRNSKIYSISRDSLTITDIIKFKTETVDKKMIKGFSDSKIAYRLGTFKQIIIYHVDNRKFEIMQFEQFNFKKIKRTMIDYGYEYFGSEPYQ
jgi:hypothetical protein